MSYFVVEESSSTIKNIAKKSLDGLWKQITIVMAIYYVLKSLIPAVLNILTPDAFLVESEVAAVIGETSYITNLYVFLTEGPIMFGLATVCLSTFRNRDANPGYLFSGFGYFFKSFGLILLISLFTFLWSLLFVIPGIIAFYSYRQAIYILADHPEKKITDCLKESKAMMQGNKFKLFKLEISFLLLIFGISLVESVLVMLGFNPFVALAIMFIPSSIFVAYMEISLTVFYELASGDLRPEIKLGTENA